MSSPEPALDHDFELVMRGVTIAVIFAYGVFSACVGSVVTIIVLDAL